MKKMMFAALSLIAVNPVFAQSVQKPQNANFTETVEYSNDKHKVETNGFWSNWFITAGAGPQVYFGDHDKQMKFGDRIAPALDVAVGKWFAPGIGVRFMYSGLSAKGATQNGSYTNGKPIEGKPWNGYWLEEQKFNYFNFHLDVLFNVSNLIAGYNEKRIYNCSPYAGIGVMKVTDTPTNAALSGHFGILNTFRLCSALDLNLDVRATLVDDDFDGEEGWRSGEGMLTATVGLTYKFNPRGWSGSKTVVRYNNAEIDAMRNKLNAMSAENEKLRKALEAGNEKQVREIVNKIAAANFITFELGKSDLSNEARVNLGLLAKVIKSVDNKTIYTITGFADSGTGSQELNERLSKARAEAVYNCLINEFKVPAAQLKIDYKGGVDNMFYDDPRMSRAVIMKSN